MDQNFMKEKKVLPLVLSMSLPMMLSMLINSLYNIIDSMFVARVGEKALTAISLVYPLQTLVTSISVGFGVGISAAVAFFLGMGEHKKADQSASEGLFLSIVHGVLMSVLLTAILPSFLRLFTTDKEIYQMGITYGTWVLSFSLVISVYIAYEKIYQSLGNMSDEYCVGSDPHFWNWSHSADGSKGCCDCYRDRTDRAACHVYCMA